jgi:cytochrome c peroxidase
MQIHWHIWEPKLTDDELDLLVDFLKTLSDESFKPQVPAQVPSGLTPISAPPQTPQPAVSQRATGDNA